MDSESLTERDPLVLESESKYVTVLMQLPVAWSTMKHGCKLDHGGVFCMSWKSAYIKID